MGQVWKGCLYMRDRSNTTRNKAEKHNELVHTTFHRYCICITMHRNMFCWQEKGNFKRQYSSVLHVPPSWRQGDIFKHKSHLIHDQQMNQQMLKGLHDDSAGGCHFGRGKTGTRMPAGTCFLARSVGQRWRAREDTWELRKGKETLY